MFTNPTPREYALIQSLFLAGLVLLLILFVRFAAGVEISAINILGITLAIFLINYAINFFLVRKYIYNRVKLIYKNIYRSKVYPFKRETDLKMDESVMDKVEAEVQDWAKRQEEEIETLKALENYRRNFIGDVSHELKTPLFNIQGYIHTLLEGGLYDEKINQSYLQKAVNNIERLNVIIEGLDTIARMESGVVELEMQGFDIRTLVEDVFQELEIQAREKGIILEFKKNADRSFTVNANRDGIRQVLNNLIMNSIKYGIEGGHTRVGFYDMDNLVLVEVADNGVGIAEEHLNRVFDRFYRVDKSRSRLKGGSGLGLSIVKHIIEAHKQTINVRSTVGVGSTFSFTLEKG